MDLAQGFVENPHLTIRKASAIHDVSRSVVHRTLKEIKFHPYKVQLHQELLDDDKRLEFCEDTMETIVQDPFFHHRICFSDEATFVINGEVNRHNSRYWSDENPRWMLESHTQYPAKVNVWAGILGNELIGPFFINGNLDAVKYKIMLQVQIVPAIQHKAGDLFDETWFQQDGAAPHYAVRNYLNEIFP